MGFFDKIKNAARSLTGGGAKVYVDVGSATLTEPFTVKVRATIADADLKVDAIYLLVQAHEEVVVSAKTAESQLRSMDSSFNSQGQLRGLVEKEETCDIRVNISGPEELQAGEEYSWEGEVTLPPGILPTFTGRNCKHVWRIQAGLDAFGNDPDSGWVEFHVS